jgi:hypothetical protein
MRDLSWEVAAPPPEPPAECHDPERWRAAYLLWQAHQPRAAGMCECREPWPCIEHMLAIRSLITTCERPSDTASPCRPARVGNTATCRWCGDPITLTSFGWIHQQVALFVCRDPWQNAPPLCVAEPD